MAQGAQIAVMDIFPSGSFGYGDLAGVGMFEASFPTGAKIHSNSWGGDLRCKIEPLSLAYDEFMVQVRGHSKHLVLETLNYNVIYFVVMRDVLVLLYANVLHRLQGVHVPPPPLPYFP